VKVAKLDLNAARMDQTPYMPEIPEIPKFSPDLHASKEWENTFITNFFEIRQVRACLGAQYLNTTVSRMPLQYQSISIPQFCNTSV
jgi:hypothetical protein